jgi:hypothetical protein
MGGHPWFYFTRYQQDINAALMALRQQELLAGRYNPVIPLPEFPVTSHSAAPGAQHASIDAARRAADADGTRSILDMDRVGQNPDFGVVAPLPKDRLMAIYGTDKPTREMVEQNMDFLEEIERGHGIYFFIYDAGEPSEIVFAGYSYD